MFVHSMSVNEGAEQATKLCVVVARAFGLSITFKKTNLMVVGRNVHDVDVEPVVIEG